MLVTAGTARLVRRKSPAAEIAGPAFAVVFGFECDGQGDALGRAWKAHHHGRNSREQAGAAADRSEEHTSELQSLMRISYAAFFLKKKKITLTNTDILIDTYH